MNQILGGGPQSRLFLDLREEHGYTYGVYSSTLLGNISGPLGCGHAGAHGRDGRLDDAVGLRDASASTTNPCRSPNSTMPGATIVAGFALSLEQPNRVLGYWLTAQYYGLPADYWDKFPDRIAAIDAAAVQAAARKYVDLDHMQWVAVGDRKQIQDVLAKYGPVSVVDAEGKPEN